MADPADDERQQAKALLTRFLPRAMEDAVLDEVEKGQLYAILTSGTLTKDDVQAVFREYLTGVYGEIVEDGMITPAEEDRLRAIVTALRIPPGFLPPELASILGL